MALEQAPEGAGVALHAVVCGNHEDRVVKGREGPLGFGAKVHVARRIHQREAGTGVLELGLGRKDGDAAVAFHGVGVQVGVPTVDAAEASDAPRVVEHGLRKRGLARVDMRVYADDCLFHVPLPVAFANWGRVHFCAKSGQVRSTARKHGDGELRCGEVVRHVLAADIAFRRHWSDSTHFQLWPSPQNSVVDSST